MRIRLTLDIERRREPETGIECIDVPSAQVEMAEARRVGFQVEPVGEQWEGRR